MKQRLDTFLELSVCLTGFGRFVLLGTGMAHEYLRVVDAILPPGVLDKLLAVYESLPAAEGRDAALADRILNDPELGPVARQLIVLWYCGSWKKLPDAWCSAYGTTPRDETHVISTAAYLAGLQWVVLGAHPAGGMQQGFGSWSEPPKGGRQ